MAKSQVKIQQTAGRDALGEFAPEFARLNDDILFGEVWSRNNLMSQGLTDSSFKYHLESAKKNGVTRTEIAEILTHAAFYAGWPKAWAAFRMAKEVWTGGNADSVAAGSLEAYAQTIIFPVGKPNDAYAKYFIGQSYTAPVVTDGVPVVNVTFEPGCRNNWHVHKATKGGGQTLVCVGGRGYYQEWGKEPVELHSGDAINIPAGVKHWHGAAPDSWFSHLAYLLSVTRRKHQNRLWNRQCRHARCGAEYPCRGQSRQTHSTNIVSETLCWKISSDYCMKGNIL